MPRKSLPPTLLPLLVREREAAQLLAVSPSQIQAWRREGLLHAVHLPTAGERRKSLRYARVEVETLARRWCRDAGINVDETEDGATTETTHCTDAA